jgi:RNA recognition motif-containing protein
MGKRVLYVGGLSDTISDSQLRDLFSAYGLVTRAYIVRLKHSQRSAGYGFVEMSSGEDALNAVITLEGLELDGRCLRLFITPYAHHDSSSPRTTGTSHEPSKP